ncbi:MAG: hypothetical protein C0606_06955 [Hyphomicrobiales bacterium]|nr:MAG: hypothetical protein C0606_06955 [Hyphomicrobiales bacterium]
MNATARNLLNHHEAFVDLTASDKAAAEVAWTIIGPQLPKVIDAFYEHLARIRQDRQLIGIDVEALKKKQFAYWEMMFAGNLKGVFEAQSKHIVAKHKARDIRLSTYLGSYGWYGIRFMAMIEGAEIPEGMTASSIMAAIHKLIVLDMMVASDAYDNFTLL